MPKPNNKTGTKIKVYDTPAFTRKFMPSEEMEDMLKDRSGTFLIVRVEDMYKLVQQNVPASRSSSHTCIFLTDGESYMKIGSELYTICKGQLLFVPAGQVFSFEAYEEHKYNTGFLLTFQNDMITGKFGRRELLKEFEFLQVWGNPQVAPPPQATLFIEQLLTRLYTEYTAHALANISLLQSYLLAFLCEVNNAYQPLPAGRQTAAITLTNKFKALLFAHVRAEHKVSAYAGMLNISPNHLNKAVRSVTGQSPARWIDEAIVAEAKALLNQTSLSVNEIAAETGLEDPSYFTRLFKKITGTTPTAFRKMIEKS